MKPRPGAFLRSCSAWAAIALVCLASVACTSDKSPSPTPSPKSLGPPTGLRIVHRTSSSLTLLWHTPKGANFGTTFPSYTVFRNGVPVSILKMAGRPAGGVVTLRDRGLASSRSYFYSVTADFGGLTSGPSERVTGRTLPR